MQIVSYQRVSSLTQANEGISLEAQGAKIEAWAETKGYSVAASFTDAGISGKKMSNRPSLLKAMETACKLKCPLVVYSISRASRSISDCLKIVEKLQASGADLISLSENLDTTTANSKFMAHIYFSIAEQERSVISERTKMALRHMQAQGKRTGRVPYGMDCKDGVNLTPNKTEQAVIAEMLEMTDKGLSLREIAKALTERGIKAKSGVDWHPESVRLVVKRNRLKEAA